MSAHVGWRKVRRTGAGALAWLTPVEWLLLLGMLVLTYRYFWLMDDAFIYFRYIDNWLFLKRGLVFNHGEYVEGYTSPAWLLLLSALRSTTLDYWTLVRGVSLVSATLFGLALVWINRELSPLGPRISLPLSAAAAHYGTASHHSSGLESPLVQLIACAYAAATLRPGSVWLQVAIGASPLIRPELALCAVVWAACYVLARRRVPGPMVISALVVNGAWLVFRVHYYADLLPNTYYLKGGAQWRQGYLYLRNVLDAHHLTWVFGGLALLGWLNRRGMTAPSGALRRPRLIMVLVACCYTAYVVRVGGDMLYYRYLAFPFCLALCASGGVAEAALSSTASTRWRSAIAPVVSVAIAAFFFIRHPYQLLSHPISLTTETRHANGIADAMWHRRHGQLKASPARPAEDAELRSRYAAATPEQRAHVAVLVHPWCRRAFFDFDKYVVHSYGLTDAFLSRVPARWGRPGHKRIRRQAQQLGRLRKRDGIRRERGAVARWIAEQRKVPSWVVRNRDELAKIELRIYNRHDFIENLGLALEPITLR